jgi:hypothetical protein
LESSFSQDINRHQSHEEFVLDDQYTGWACLRAGIIHHNQRLKIL